MMAVVVVEQVLSICKLYRSRIVVVIVVVLLIEICLQEGHEHCWRISVTPVATHAMASSVLPFSQHGDLQSSEDPVLTSFPWPDFGSRSVYVDWVPP